MKKKTKVSCQLIHLIDFLQTKLNKNLAHTLLFYFPQIQSELKIIDQLMKKLVILNLLIDHLKYNKLSLLKCNVKDWIKEG